MSPLDDSPWRDRDAEGGEDPDEDPGDGLEAMIEQADRPFASSSFGTTAEEQEEGLGIGPPGEALLEMTGRRIDLDSR